MPNLTSVGVTSGVPTSGTGTVSTLDAVLASKLSVDVTTIAGAAPNANGQATMANSAPMVIASNQSALPVSESGTWTVQPGNTANTTPWLTTDSATVAQNSTTSGQSGALVQGAATTSAPSYTNAQTAPLSLVPVGGGLRTVLLGTAGTQITSRVDNADAVAVLGTTVALATSNRNNNFNGTSWDRQYSNFDTAGLVAISAAGTSTLTSADQTNFNGRGLQLGINVTVATAVTLTVSIQGKDVASGTYYNILTSAALATTGFTNMTIYPGAGVTANVSSSMPLPRVWRISAAIVGTSVTATIGASVIV